ncbi:MAG: hypothetical protein KAJ93_02415 [Methanosarcinales archaeon]|nr:hypothetical protein [Methanosarcinales archaeon]
MKYFKKDNGDCGTMDDDGYVPGSTEITKSEYDDYVSNLPAVSIEEPIVEYEDVDTGKILKLRKIK